MLDNVFSGKDVADFRIWLEWADRYVILTHISPDGDAMGSSLALYQFLTNRGKSATVIVPSNPPEFLNWLPGADKVVSYKSSPAKADKLIQNSDVICCLDFNVISRIGDVAASFLYSKAQKIMIDHHPFPGSNCSVVLSHPEASSTCELVFLFLCALGEYENITTEMSMCLYTGMMTDTGAFSYNSNNPQIFNIISYLLAKGIDKDDIYRRVYHSYSESRFRLMGYVMCRKMKLFPKMSTALISLSDKELREYHYKNGDSEGFVNLPLQIDGIKFTAFLREDKAERIIKVSLRSIGDVPCNKFAEAYFNGGGHLNASGGEFHDSLDKAIERFEQGLNEWSSSEDESIRQLFVE